MNELDWENKSFYGNTYYNSYSPYDYGTIQTSTQNLAQDLNSTASQPGFSWSDLFSNIGVQVGTGLANYALSKYSTKQQNKYNAEMAMYQQADRDRQITYYNTYNSPAAQMQRLMEAGLNPYLVYGSGNVTGNMSGTGSSIGYQKTANNYQARMQDALNMRMAINNHDADMTMKRQEIIAAARNNRINNSFQALQSAIEIEKMKNEDKILQAEVRSARAKADMDEHDLSVVEKNPNVLSKNSGLTDNTLGWVGRFLPSMVGLDRFFSKPYKSGGAIKWK